MHRGDGMVDRIGNQNGYAIGGSDRQSESRAIGDQGIGFTVETGGAGEDHPIRVNLPNCSHGQCRPLDRIPCSEAVQEMRDGRQVRCEKH